MIGRAHVALRTLLHVPDAGSRVADGVLACAYPRADRALAALSRRHVALLINLHETPHDCQRLERFGMRDLHLPVADFTAPTPDQLAAGVAALDAARAGGEVVAVHCGAGLGRTGTLLACWLVRADGVDAATAIARVRRARPGAIETVAQEAAVAQFAAAHHHCGDMEKGPER